jgi:WD40 repeat protein
MKINILIIISFCFFILSIKTFSQPPLYVMESNVSNFPQVDLKFFAYDNNGKLITNISQSDVNVTDNGTQLQVTSLECPNQQPAENVSVVITLDLGMSTDYGYSSHFDTGKILAKSIIDSLDSLSSDIALSSYDFFSFINLDFSRNKSQLNGVLAFMSAQKSSFLDTGFISPIIGALQVAERGKFDKSIIFITDGKREINKQNIINFAEIKKIRIFCVSLSDSISDELKEVSIKTGGYWFTNSTKPKNIFLLTRILRSLIFKEEPCKVSFIGEVTCVDTNRITINIPSKAISGEFVYNLPEQFKTRLESSPPYISFSAVLPNTSRTHDITLTARNGDIIIKKFSFTDSIFSIISGDVPQDGQILIKSGSSITITVRFAPTDSAYVFVPLIIESDACYGNKIYITGGFPNKPPKKRTLNIRSPKPNEILAVGDTVLISWEGLLPEDLIQLEYSLDSGKTWDILATDVSGLQYRWAVPDTLAQSVFIRAIQLWPNNIGETTDFFHPNQVNCANFNIKDGNFIITACRDSIARIWNSNSTSELIKLTGHSGSVLWVVIDSTETYAATASEDSTVRLWNFQTGQLINTYRGHHDIVTSCNFSPDGKKLISSGFDGMAYIWSIDNNKAIDSINCNQGRIRYAEYDPKGNNILSAGGNGTVKLWNASSKKLIKTFSTNQINEAIYHCSFSPEGDKIVGTTSYGRAFIWNTLTGDTLYSIDRYDTIAGVNSLFCGNFHRTGIPLTIGHLLIPANTLLLITSGVGGINIWDGEKGTPICELTEHRQAVTTAFFNFNGSRIVTASWDSTAKVWNLGERGFQTDTSGELSIKKVSMQCPNVSFGIVLIGEANDTTLSPFINNNAGFGYRIQNITIDGANASSFAVIDGFAPYYLDSSSSHQIRISFKPEFTGTHTANINIELPFLKITRNLTANGIDPSLKSYSRIINFGKIHIGDIKDSTIEGVIKNYSNNAIIVSKIIKSGPDSVQFNLLNVSTPFTLLPNGSIPLKMQFSPDKIGRTSGQIFYYYAAESSPGRIMLFAEGVAPLIDTAVIYIPDTSAKPGDVISLPVFLIANKNKPGKISLNSVNFDLLFNSTLLEPLGLNQAINISEGQRRIHLQFSPINSSDSIIGRIKFKIGLGNDSLTILKIENLELLGQKIIVIIKNDALFTLKGICEEGGARLFEPNGKLSLSESWPNPASDAAEFAFEIAEYGNAKIYVYDLNGKIVKVIYDNYIRPGKYSFKFSLIDVPSGNYQCILKINDRTLTKGFEIVK